MSGTSARRAIRDRRPCRHRRRPPDAGRGGSVDPARDGGGRRSRRHGLGLDPGLPAQPARRLGDPLLADAELRRDPDSLLPHARALEGPDGLQLPADGDVLLGADAALCGAGHADPCRHSRGAGAGARRLVPDRAHGRGLPGAGRRPQPAGRALRRLPRGARRLALHGCSAAGWRAGRHLRGSGPFGQMVPSFPVGYGFTAIIVAFLGRLHPLGIVLAALVLARPMSAARARRRRSACRPPPSASSRR